MGDRGLDRGDRKQHEERRVSDSQITGEYLYRFQKRPRKREGPGPAGNQSRLRRKRSTVTQERGDIGGFEAVKFFYLKEHGNNKPGTGKLGRRGTVRKPLARKSNSERSGRRRTGCLNRVGGRCK